MRHIRHFLNEVDYRDHYLVDKGFINFLRKNQCNIAKGWRIYDGTVSKSTDITEDANKIAACESIVFMLPAKGVLGGYALYAAVAAVIAAAAIVLLTPKITAPNTSARDQSSSTNALGARENEPGNGKRADDVWGKVTGFVPKLIQVPHIRMEDNAEVEHFAVHFSMGKTALENFKDGDTPFNLIPGGKINAWWPGGNPNHPTNTTPDYNIGGLINRPINNVSISNELQSSELLPPNDLDVANITWRVTTVNNGNGTWGVTITGQELAENEISLLDYIQAGGEFGLFQFILARINGTQALYRPDGIGGTIQKDFDKVDNFDLSDSYIADAVTDSVVTFTSSNADWNGWSDSPAQESVYFTKNKYTELDPDYIEFYTLDVDIENYDWWSTAGLIGDSEMSYTTDVYLPSVGTLGGNLSQEVVIHDDADSITLNLIAQNGFYKLVKNNERTVTINVDFIFTAKDSGGLSIGETILSDTFTSNAQSITRQAADTYDFNKSQWDNYPSAASYTVKLRRTTNRDKSDNANAVDKVFWRDLYFIENIGDQDYGNLTMGQVAIPSTITSQNVKKRLINCDATRYITPYQRGGTFGTEAPISTWAEVLIGLALDNLNGRLTIDSIDAETLLDIQDELIAYYGTTDAVQVGYDFDSTKIRFQEQYSLLCNAVNVKPFSSGGVFKGYADIERTTSSKQFTHRTKIPNTDGKTRSYEQEYDGVEVTYRSNVDGKFDTVVRHFNGIDSYNRMSIELSGAVNEAQATIRCNRELNILKYQRYSYEWESDSIGRLTIPGERVDNVDYTRIVKRENNMNLYAVYSGYVVEQNGLTVELSEDVTFEDGEAHTIRFTNLKGNLLEIIGCTKGASSRLVVLDEEPSEPLYTAYKKEKTNFTMASDSQRNSLPVIIRGSKGSNKNNLKTRKLTAVNYDERYFQNDHDFAE